MVYGIDPDGRFYDEDTYFRVQAESLAAAALLAGIQPGAFRRSPAWCVVSHPVAGQPPVQRRKKPGRQGRPSHDGRMLRSVERRALNEVSRSATNCHES
jgi:hypothetical protein